MKAYRTAHFWRKTNDLLTFIIESSDPTAMDHDMNFGKGNIKTI